MTNNLQLARKKAGLTGEQVAKILNISRNALSYYENQKREANYSTLKKLSELYGVTIDYLLDNSSSEIQSTEQAKDIWMNTLNELDYSLVTTIFKLNELQKYKAQAYMFGMLEKQ